MKKHVKTKIELLITAAAVIAVVALVNYIAGKFYHRIDLTENKQYTVSDATKRVLKGLDDIVTVKAFFSKDLPPEMLEVENAVRDLLAEYKNIGGGKLRVTWADPATDSAAAIEARGFGIQERGLQTVKKDKVQVMLAYAGLGIMHGDKIEALPLILHNDLPRLEYNLTYAIMKVSRTQTPKIGILKSQSADFIPEQFRSQMNMTNETTENKFVPLFRSAIAREYELVTVDVSEGKPIDGSIRTLIIPGGDRFTERAIFEIDQYFMNGGNLIVLANATSISFQYGQPQVMVQETKLIELLRSYGVKIEPNIIMDASCSYVQIPRTINTPFGQMQMNEPAAYPYFVRVTGDGFARDNPAAADVPELVLGWPSSLSSLTDSVGGGAITFAALVSSSQKSWSVTETFDIEPKINPAEYGIPSENDMRTYTLAAHLSGSFKSRFDGSPVPPIRDPQPDEDSSAMSQINLIGDDLDRTVKPSNENGNIVVVGDANFITTTMVNNPNSPNLLFMHNIIDWLSLDENLIAPRSRTMRDKTINADVLGEGSSKTSMIRWINLLLMPLVVTAVGIIIFLKRREKISVAAPQNKDNNNKEGN